MGSDAPLDTVPAEFVVWQESLAFAYQLAKAERLAELRGDRRIRRFNEAGLHPYSIEWGQILAVEALAPVYGAARGCGGEPLTPYRLKREAEADAEAEFVEELRAKGVGALHGRSGGP